MIERMMAWAAKKALRGLVAALRRDPRESATDLVDALLLARDRMAPPPRSDLPTFDERPARMGDVRGVVREMMPSVEKDFVLDVAKLLEEKLADDGSRMDELAARVDKLERTSLEEASAATALAGVNKRLDEVYEEFERVYKETREAKTRLEGHSEIIARLAEEARSLAPLPELASQALEMAREARVRASLPQLSQLAKALGLRLEIRPGGTKALDVRVPEGMDIAGVPSYMVKMPDRLVCLRTSPVGGGEHVEAEIAIGKPEPLSPSADVPMGAGKAREAMWSDVRRLPGVE